MPLQLPNCYDISRDDEIAFVKLGISNDLHRSDYRALPRMELEKTDTMQASDFEIKFIAFKPPLNLPDGLVVPRRFYFTMNFFTFPQTKSDVA